MLAMTAALDARLDRLREVMSKISIFIQNTESVKHCIISTWLISTSQGA